MEITFTNLKDLSAQNSPRSARTGESRSCPICGSLSWTVNICNVCEFRRPKNKPQAKSLGDGQISEIPHDLYVRAISEGKTTLRHTEQLQPEHEVVQLRRICWGIGIVLLMGVLIKIFT